LFFFSFASSSPSFHAAQILSSYPHLPRFAPSELRNISMKLATRDSHDCPNFETFPFEYHEPRPMKSLYCSQYEKSSCCSYEETYLIHFIFVNYVLFQGTGNFRGFGEECAECIENLMCFPCSPKLGSFLHYNKRTKTITFQICEDTCEYIFESCHKEQGFPYPDQKELCQNLEMSIEEAFVQGYDYYYEQNYSFPLLDVVISRDSDVCFNADSDDREDHGISGCATAWVVIIVLGLVAFGILAGWKLVQWYKRRQPPLENVFPQQAADGEIHSL